MSRPALLSFLSMQRWLQPHATLRGFGCTRLSKGQECNARAADSLSLRYTKAYPPALPELEEETRNVT